jgi:hypothetical protein
MMIFTLRASGAPLVINRVSAAPLRMKEGVKYLQY